MCVFVHSSLVCYVLTPFQMQRLCGIKLDPWMWTMNRAERRAWRLWNVVMDCFWVRYDPAGLPRRNVWRLPELPAFDYDSYRMQIIHITVRFHRATSCECTHSWLATQSDEGGATTVKPAWQVSCHQIDRCHGAAAVLSIFTVLLSPLFQYAISQCNSVYGETLLSNFTWQ